MTALPLPAELTELVLDNLREIPEDRKSVV